MFVTPALAQTPASGGRRLGMAGIGSILPADRPDLRDHVFPDPAAAAGQSSGSTRKWSPMFAAATRS